MSNWPLLNAHRVNRRHDSIYGSEPSDGFNGLFCLSINGLRIMCIASDGEGWKHVSVSIGGSQLPPSWSVMSQIKDLFWEPEDWVAQFHPAHSEYVNQHPGVLHLWQPLNAELPKPNRLMVGPKDEADVQEIERNKELPLLMRLAARNIFEANKPKAIDSSSTRVKKG